MRKKITVIGAGNVGASVAQYCLVNKLGDIVLLDLAEGVAKGKALDLAQAAMLQKHFCRIKGTVDYIDTANSAIVIITAGIARKPGMSRDDLVKTNLTIVKNCVTSVMRHSPDAILIVVSNPLDIMCKVALDASGLPPHRVLGLSGMLDTARFKYYLAEAIGGDIAPSCMHALVIGEHGDSMVPLPRYASVGGVPLSTFLSMDKLAEASRKAATGGAAIVSLMGTSAYYAPGIGAASMAEAILNDSHSVMPCSVYLTGQYGANDMFMCVPVRLGRRGVEEIIEVELDAEEKVSITASIANIREKLAILNEA